MPSSLLFGINNEGRVHTLSTSGSMWREVPYMGQEFKKLSAVPHFLWALGGDFQVYVYVHGLDVPIRVREESYENERWIPIDGFSNRLLPTDRFHFSSIDGTVDRAISKVRLPSMAWQWEGDWSLELQLDGQPLDHDGWTYAVDFPARYHAHKQWKSCVRRRLWVRNRKYVALNSWCAISPLHQDATAEPFIDIAVGGQYISGAESGVMVVWAVTSNNRVMFRNGVSTRLPEGAKWILVSTPTGCEADQLAVGGSGSVWVALLDGRALVRIGVCRDCHIGNGWVEVNGPYELNKQVASRINHLAVGSGIGGSMGAVGVWAITQDNRAWFRKGVQIDSTEDTQRQTKESVIGLQWVEMVGRMTMISISAASNQVFAISADDRSIYYRVGITTTDICGKRWKKLRAPLQASRASSVSTLSGRHADHHSSSLMTRPNSFGEGSSSSLQFLNSDLNASASVSDPHVDSWQEQSHSAPNAVTSIPAGDPSSHQYFEAPLKNPKAWSPVRSVGSVLGTEVLSDESVHHAEQQDSCIFSEDEEMGWAEFESRWCWVEVGACTIDQNHLPMWLCDENLLTGEVLDINVSQHSFNSPWRLRIHQDLRRREHLVANIDTNVDSTTTWMIKGIEYESAVEGSSWTHTGAARWSPDGGTANFVDCIMQFERQTGDGGTLTILADDGATSLHAFAMEEITCIQCCSEPGNARLTVHTPQLNPAMLRLQFTSEGNLDEWLKQLNNACSEIQRHTDTVNFRSVWATTTSGDIFICDDLPLIGPNTLNEIEIDLLEYQTPFTIPLDFNCIPGTILTFTGNVLDSADRFSVNLDARPTFRQRHKTHSELGNTVLHFNPRFHERIIIRNTMTEGKWGKEQRGIDTGNNGGGQDNDIDTFPLRTGEACTIKFLCRQEDFVIFVADREYCTFRYRTFPASAVSLFSVCGAIEPFKLRIQTTGTILSPLSLHWRQLGGHLRRIETCESGVIWGVAYDHTAWVYTGAPLHQQHTMNDSQDYRIYENQRWNPISGYSSSGLPTDRYSWSDVTGKQRRTKDHAKLLSRQWQWISDWLVDFHVPGGVDRDGWQYAVDFPSTFHAQKHFTDYVRRRRWYRRCAIITSGPWIELGRTKLLDVTLQPLYGQTDGDHTLLQKALDTCDNNDKMETTTTMDDVFSTDSNGIHISVWSLATGGQVMYRDGVTTSNHMGTKWEHVPSDQPFCSISSHYDKSSYKLWAIGNNGCAYLRIGITSSNHHGDKWQCIEPPNGSNVQLKQVSVGDLGVWCLDIGGRLYLRRDVTEARPLGTCWQCLPPDPASLPTGCTGFRQVSLSARIANHVTTVTPQQYGEVWAITNAGVLLRREGISEKWPAGTGWSRGIQGNWQHINIRAFN